MEGICPKCGQPKELCVCGEIAKEQQKIHLQVTRRRFGKTVTLISGFDKSADLNALGKELRKKLACGGTVKNGVIELQGDQKERAKQMLIKMGYKEELLDG
ncbi:MAG: translation initiation factor [Candidatus Diapherotrites archaeon]|nr:translation initiation factor [Candidatus Diapherotrites archaeon]